MKSKVLVVDDDPVFRGLVRRILKGMDCETVEVSDAALLPGVLGSERPAVVILDVHMPRLDGMAALDELRRRHPDVPVIVATADADASLARLAAERGARDFIVKPVGADELQTVVQAALLAG